MNFSSFGMQVMFMHSMCKGDPAFE